MYILKFCAPSHYDIKLLSKSLHYSFQSNSFYLTYQGRSQGGADGAAAPPWHVTSQPWGGRGAAAPPWHGCKDPKLTKKRGKHKKKMIKNY